jgi:heptose I phosphotransferase
LTAEEKMLVIPSPGGTVWVNPAFQKAVEGLSLHRFAEAMRFIGGERVDANRKRSVVRIRFEGERFFLKRFTHPPAKDALGRVFRLKRPKTHAEHEWEMIQALGEIGVGAPDVAGVGAERGRGFRRRSFLLTAELTDHVPLDRYLEERATDFRRPSGRRGFLEDLAGLVHRMHASGISHPDLYSWHIFVRGTGGERAFALIDLHRAAQRKRISLFDAVRDLTGLHLTVPRGTSGRTDRLRFLRAYFGKKRLGPSGKRLARKVLRRARRIATRRRFRDLAEI